MTDAEIFEILGRHDVRGAHFRLAVASVLLVMAQGIPGAVRDNPVLQAGTDVGAVVGSYEELIRRLVERDHNLESKQLLRLTVEHFCHFLEELDPDDT